MYLTIDLNSKSASQLREVSPEIWPLDSLTVETHKEELECPAPDFNMVRFVRGSGADERIYHYYFEGIDKLPGGKYQVRLGGEAGLMREVIEERKIARAMRVRPKKRVPVSNPQQEVISLMEGGWQLREASDGSYSLRFFNMSRAVLPQTIKAMQDKKLLTFGGYKELKLTK